MQSEDTEAGADRGAQREHRGVGGAQDSWPANLKQFPIKAREVMKSPKGGTESLSQANVAAIALKGRGTKPRPCRRGRPSVCKGSSRWRQPGCGGQARGRGGPGRAGLGRRRGRGGRPVERWRGGGVEAGGVCGTPPATGAKLGPILAAPAAPCCALLRPAAPAERQCGTLLRPAAPRCAVLRPAVPAALLSCATAAPA